MSTVNELFAPKFMTGDRADRWRSRTRWPRARAPTACATCRVEAVARCIGLPDERLCRACITGDYPTPTGEQLYQLALRNHANGDADGRTYDRPNEPLVCSVTDARPDLRFVRARDG